mgnify:CR=1 FL=1
MVFIHDTEMSLRAAAALVNTLPTVGVDAEDRLSTQADFDAYLDEFSYTGTFHRDDDELAAVRANRPRLRELWRVGRDEAVPLVNAMLRDGRALPQLVRHDEFDWHIHATEPDAPPFFIPILPLLLPALRARRPAKRGLPFLKPRAHGKVASLSQVLCKPHQ